MTHATPQGVLLDYIDASNIADPNYCGAQRVLQVDTACRAQRAHRAQRAQRAQRVQRVQRVQRAQRAAHARRCAECRRPSVDEQQRAAPHS